MAQWNFNCPNCIYYKPLEACRFSACRFTPIQTVTTNKTQIVEADTTSSSSTVKEFQIINELAEQYGKEVRDV